MTIKVLIDTDPGIDDAMALIFAHLAPSIEIVGITTVMGNGSIETVTQNALYICEQFDINVPIHQGAAQPLLVAPEAPAAFVHGDDALGNVQPPTASHSIGEQYAAGFIVDTILAHPHEITLVSLGRLTNIAMALRINPDIANLVKQVVVMGGALGSNQFTGNISPVAEANIYGDPHAADLVLTAAWPVTLVGLDVTMQCIMTATHVQDLRSRAGSAGQFIWDITRHYDAFYRSTHGTDGFAIHDSCPIAYLLAPELFDVQAGPVRVVTEGISRGQTILVPAGKRFPPNAWDNLTDQQGALNVDPTAVINLYLETLSQH